MRQSSWSWSCIRDHWINRSKSLFHILRSSTFSSNLLPSGIPILRNGFVLLGCWSVVFYHSVLMRKVVKVKELLSRVPKLQHSQMENTLLHHCLSFPKFTFSLKTCPPTFTREGATSLDKLLRTDLSDMVGSPVSDLSWLKASLPCSRGGLGLCRSVLDTPAAHAVCQFRGGNPSTLLPDYINWFFPKEPQYRNFLSRWGRASPQLGLSRTHWVRCCRTPFPHALTRLRITM